jgi:hypothetical protein
MAESVATGEALPQGVETSRGGAPIAEPDAVGRGDAFAVFEYCLRQALQLFSLRAAGLFGARLERRRYLGEESVDQAVARIGQPWVECDHDRRRMARLGPLRNHVEDRGFPAAARSGKAENDAGRSPLGLDQRAEHPSDEILAQEPVVPLGFDRPLDVVIH